MGPLAKILPALKTLRARAEKEASRLPPLMAEAERVAASIMSGEHSQRAAGMGEKFWQFREYHPTDRPQDIDWRQSAKGDRIFIRQKEWQTPQTCFFWCAATPAMAYRSDDKLPAKAETGMVIALALALLMTRADENVAALAGRNQAGRSPAAVENLGQDLLETALPFARLNQIKTARNSTLVLVGDFLEPMEELEKTFKDLAGRVSTAMIIQILDPAELNLPFSGRVIFEDPARQSGGAGTERHHIANVQAIRQEYQARMQHHQDSLRSLCRRLGWRFILHCTEEKISDTLLNIWHTAGAENNIIATGDATSAADQTAKGGKA